MTRLQANLLLLLIALIWGASFTVQKVSAGHMGALGFSAARFLVGAVVVAPVVWLEVRRADPALLRRFLGHWPGLAATGLALCGGAVLQQVGIGGTSVTNAGFLTGLYVPLVPLLGLLLLGARPHPVVWPAALSCLAGTWMLSGGSAVALSWGDVWVVVSTVFWAGHVILIGRMARITGLPTLVALVQFVLAGGISAGLAAAIEPATVAELRAAWFEIAFVGILSVGVAFTLQSVAQRHADAAAAAVILSSETVFSALGGMLVLGERPGPWSVAGCAVIFVAMLAVQLSSRDGAAENPPQHPPSAPSRT